SMSYQLHRQVEHTLYTFEGRPCPATGLQYTTTRSHCPELRRERERSDCRCWYSCVHSDSRVEDGVEEVRDQVGDDGEQTRDQDIGHDRVEFEIGRAHD